MKLNLRSIDLNLLPVFVAVVEEGQLSRAADRLGMSQPAVSAALQRLRITAGDPLFTRSRIGLVPTPRARELCDQVSAGLNVIADALDPGRQFDPDTANRTFRICAVDYFETLMLGSLMAALRQQSRAIGIKIVPQQGDWHRRLISAELDFAMDSMMPEDDRLTGVVVGYEQISVVVRKGHPEIIGELTMAQFLEAEHVVLPERERHTLPLDQILGHPGWQRKIGAQVMHFSNLLSVASSSDLIATVPARMAERMAANLDLQVLPFPVATPDVPVYLFWPIALEKDKAHQWFREFLINNIPVLLSLPDA